jgi:hypothetical protein
MLPQTWKELTITNYEHMIKIIDYQNEGYIDLNKIVIFIILSNCHLPSFDAMEEYHNALTSYNTVKELSASRFHEVVAWFDE